MADEPTEDEPRACRSESSQPSPNRWLFLVLESREPFNANAAISLGVNVGYRDTQGKLVHDQVLEQRVRGCIDFLPSSWLSPERRYLRTTSARKCMLMLGLPPFRTTLHLCNILVSSAVFVVQLT